MKRRLFTILSALSLVLCITAVVDRCVRRGQMDWFGFLVWHIDGPTRIATELSVTTRQGIALFGWNSVAQDAKQTPPPAGHFEHGTVVDNDDLFAGKSIIGRAGFWVEVHRLVRGPNVSANWITFRHVAVPMWFLALLLLVWPAIHLRNGLERRRRARKGLCGVCGYDLRASKDRCPECGTPIPAQTANSGGKT